MHELHPSVDGDGNPDITVDEYWDILCEIKRKDPLREACNTLSIPWTKSASLDSLRTALQNHWYPNEIRIPESLRLFDEEVGLVAEFAQFGGEDTAAQEVLAIDIDDEDEDDEYEAECEDQDDEVGIVEASKSEETVVDDPWHEDFKQKTRVDANQRAENNRRAGGRRTQKAMVKAHKEFSSLALEKGEIKDEIIDEHHLLLFIKFCAERPKRTRRGIDIPGTFIGASHLKKLYFGALRIRKEQDAFDPRLKIDRPATSVYVWDALKDRMNEALSRSRSGLMAGEDAPDVIANTFLDSITNTDMEKIGLGFLAHRELRCVINGHLAWTCQNATGNRGDDIRALKLSEIQPYTMTHPNEITKITTILGLQGEEKAGGHRGMRTKINPVYSAFIAHRDPLLCPMGALSFYLHFIFDVKLIHEKMDIDWHMNKSWRQASNIGISISIRLLHGSKSPNTPYNEQNLYSLYVRAFADAGFDSVQKVHFPRHNLGYRQERLGVDPHQTARLGWVRGETYHDTYAPALPKPAILGAHGFRVSEAYDPIWTHVHVPEQFLRLVCPMAEDIHESLVLSRTTHLKGATRFWEAVMMLRPYLFQCGAAIFQKFPKSNLFKLPALANQDVQNWMKTEYPQSIRLLQIKAGNPIEFKRVENEMIRQGLEGLMSMMTSNTLALQEMDRKLERRTAVLSPSKSFSVNTYSERYLTSNSNNNIPRLSAAAPVPQTPRKKSPELAVYEVDASDSSESSPSRLRAFVNESPRTATSPRERTQVDLVLPPTEAFTKPNEPMMLWPPVMGQTSVTWEYVFTLIKRPEFLWECWGLSTTLENLTLDKAWSYYISGEQVFNSENVQTGIKPPLCLVEQAFQGKWRKKPNERKAWQRYREIPEYIDSESAKRGVSPQSIISELEHWRNSNSARSKGLCALGRHLEYLRKNSVPTATATNTAPSTTTETSSKPQKATKRKAATIAPRRQAKKAKKE